MTAAPKRRGARRWPVVVAAVALAAVELAGLGGPAVVEAADPALDRVEHVVVVVSGGRTFDSVLGRFPGVDGIPTDTPRPDMSDTQPLLASDRNAATAAWSAGGMNGFAAAQTTVGLDAEAPFDVARQKLLPAVWELAGDGVVGERAFASRLDGAVANRRALFGYPVPATGLDPALPPPALAGGSILDALDAAGVGWGVYVDGLDPAVGLPIGAEGQRIEGLVPPLGDPTVADVPARAARIEALEAFHLALIGGTLPPVSFVVSTAPETDTGAADTLTVDVANAIARSSAWSSTVLVVTWDAWGGYADHVAPPIVADVQLGFRVPLVVAGPLVAAGAIDRTDRSHESILRLIEDRFGIVPRNPSEAAAASLADLVTADGSRPPRLLRDDVVRYLPGVGYRAEVLATYLASLGLGIVLVGAAWLVDRRRPGGDGEGA